MLCILKVDGLQIKSWIIAADMDEAIERADHIGAEKLADALRILQMPENGKRDLLGGRYIILDQRDD